MKVSAECREAATKERLGLRTIGRGERIRTSEYLRNPLLPGIRRSAFGLQCSKWTGTGIQSPPAWPDGEQEPLLAQPLAYPTLIGAP